MDERSQSFDILDSGITSFFGDTAWVKEIRKDGETLGWLHTGEYNDEGEISNDATWKFTRKKEAKIVVLPTIPIGVNANLFGFPMTLHLSPTTQLAILKDIVHALEVHKIYKLVLLNSHGGNEFKALLREIYGKTKVHVFLINWWTLIEELINKVCEDKTGEHANEAETSWMMYLYPELVHLEWADEGKVRKPVLKGLEKGWAWMARPWHLLTVSSGYGNPKKANAEKGKILVEDAVDKIASFLVELSKAKIDQYFPYKKEID